MSRPVEVLGCNGEEQIGLPTILGGAGFYSDLGCAGASCARLCFNAVIRFDNRAGARAGWALNGSHIDHLGIVALKLRDGAGDQPVDTQDEDLPLWAGRDGVNLL